MEFKTALSMAEISLVCGFWKPLFKTRLGNNYADFSKRDELEKTLHRELFGNNTETVIIAHNKYEFNLGPGYKQYVIWCRDNLIMVDHAYDIAKKLFPNSDYHIVLNKSHLRSIKSIYHYHLVTKIHQAIPSKLKHLIIFNRHANRTPIMFFPQIENILGNVRQSYPDNPTANLTDLGRSMAKKFGSELLNIYELDNAFVENNCFISSPFDRCIDTVNEIANGMGIIEPRIQISDILRFKLNRSDYLEDSSDKIIGIISSLNNRLGTNVEPLGSVLYDFLSSMRCYEDVGINFEEIFGKDFINDFTLETKYHYNLMSDFFSRHYGGALCTIINSIISNTINSNINLSICSTHDHLIFIMMKYLTRLNNFIDKNLELELPEYLSNIRIEIWTDETRIYYNNWYIGCIYN